MNQTENASGPSDVTVEDLKVHFPVRTGVLRRVAGTVRAVDGVSFTVPAQSTVGLVGESGSGKSTTGRALIGLAPVSGGRVRLHGRDLADRRRDGSLTRLAQIIYQDPFSSLNPRMTIAATLREVPPRL